MSKQHDDTEMTEEQWEEWLKSREESKDWIFATIDGVLGVFDDEGKKVV